MVIPEAQRGDIIERIHQADQCQPRTRSCVFWPDTNKDIEAREQKCEICQESQKTQAKKTREPHEVPTKPRQVIATDLFS